MPAPIPPDPSKGTVQAEHGKLGKDKAHKAVRYGQRVAKRLSPIALLKKLIGRKDTAPPPKAPSAPSLQQRTSTRAEDQRHYTALPKASKASDVLPEYQEGKVREPPGFDSAEKGRLLGKGTYGEAHLVSNSNKVGENEISESPTRLQKQYVVKTQNFKRSPNGIQDHYLAAEREFEHQKLVPDTVRVSDLRRIKDGHQALMEYGGVELRALVPRGKSKALPMRLARDLGRQMMEQLRQCHDTGVIHRDIKPENLLVNHQGKLSLADFGLSLKLQDSRAHAGQELKGRACSYRAPEVFKGEGYSCNADVWSAGVVFAEMLLGECPLFVWKDIFAEKGKNDIFIFDYSAVKRFRKKISTNKKLEPQLKALLLGMIDPDPKTRLSAEQAAGHPFFTEAQELSDMSYPELQTRHKKLFDQLALRENQLKEATVIYQEGKDDDACQLVQDLEMSVLKLGINVRQCQSWLRIRELESQENSLRREINKARRAQRGFQRLFRKRLRLREEMEQRLNLSLGLVESELNKLRSELPLPLPSTGRSE